MSVIVLTIATDNAAFGAFPEIEVARIFRHTADRFEVDGVSQTIPDTFPLLDANGNTVGRVEVTP